MKITDIKQQVKRQGRFSIYVDGKYSFSLSENEYLLQGLRIGQEFNKSEFDKIKDSATEDKAYMRALDMLARRDRSTWEIQEYLRRKGYDQDLIEKILNKLSKRELLDDKRFAKSWVVNRHLLKDVSRRKLMQELQQKRISQDIISEVLAKDENDETESLKNPITKKRTQTRYKDDQKLIAYLLRQGFNYEDIKSAMDG